MIVRLRAWWRLRKCRRHGHQFDDRTHYARDMVVALRRCGRCGYLDSSRTKVSTPLQYPRPRA